MMRVVEQQQYLQDCGNVVGYMQEYHRDEWVRILDMIEKESGGIPDAFLEAFREEGA